MRKLKELGAIHLDIRPRHSYRWQHYMNKLYAIGAAERATKSRQVLWLDSDIIFLGEPQDLELGPNEDFAACAPDNGVIGSEGEKDPNDPFWRHAAPAMGQRIEDLPWLDTSDGKRIRFYWNSGVFVYNKSTCLAEKYLDDCIRYMDKQVAKSHNQVHFMDQVVLGFTVLRLKLRWRALSGATNYTALAANLGQLDQKKLLSARVLHYHDSMDGHAWQALLSRLAVSHPQVHAWLLPLGPVTDVTGTPWRMFRKSLRVTRGLQRQLYYRRSGFSA